MRCTGRGKKLRGAWRQREDQREPEELVQDLSLLHRIGHAGTTNPSELNEIMPTLMSKKREMDYNCRNVKTARARNNSTSTMGR